MCLRLDLSVSGCQTLANILANISQRKVDMSNNRFKPKYLAYLQILSN